MKSAFVGVAVLLVAGTTAWVVWPRETEAPKSEPPAVPTAADPSVEPAGEENVSADLRRSEVTTAPSRPAREQAAVPDTPRDESDERAPAVPYAVAADLAVSVVDQTRGVQLEQFAGVFWGDAPRGERWTASQPVHEQKVAVPDHGVITVEITAPEWARSVRTVRVSKGVHERVDFRVRSGPGTAGEVRDPQGRPVDSALVYWGEAPRLRRSVFRGYEPENVFEGVRTNTRGVYRLMGRAALLTVWHPDYSPVTVPATAAAVISLPARGGIRGLLVDDNEQPRAGITIRLDRARETVTDEAGQFEFDRVEAGVHGLEGEGLRPLAVVVEPDAITAVENPFHTLRTVEVQLQSGGQPWTERLSGVVVGIDAVSTIHEFGSKQGVVRLGRIRPGRYVLLASSGQMAWFDAQAEPSIADLGTASLTVRMPAGTRSRVYVAPHGANESVLHFCRRFATSGPPGVGEAAPAEIVFAPLPPGSYDIGVPGRGIVREVEIGEDDVEVVLGR